MSYHFLGEHLDLGKRSVAKKQHVEAWEVSAKEELRRVLEE